MSKSKFPIVVKRGHTIVKIYLTPSRGCESFTVVHYVGDVRKRKTFASLDLAKVEAEAVANRLSQGELRVLTLTNHDGLAYSRAVEALRPTGVSIELAAINYAEAFRILGGDKLVEAARFYAMHHPSNKPSRLVPEVVKELIEAKEQDGVSTVYVKDLRGRLDRFAKKFADRMINLVTAAEIEDFLRGLKQDGDESKGLSPRSRNNYRRLIGTLLYFAESRHHIPKGLVDVESVAVAKEPHTDIVIFKPEELVEVLAAADESLVPFLSIGAFAGLRHAELQRLDWSDVNLEEGFIEVRARIAKTASRRLVPISANLKAWLANHKKANGPVCDYANMSKQLMWLAEGVSARRKEADPETGFEWKRNGLRHSYISYRVAETQNVAQTALEAGNSPRMVFANYRELVRPKDAEKWFGITPESVAAFRKAKEEEAAAREREAAAKVVVFPSAAVA